MARLGRLHREIAIPARMAIDADDPHDARGFQKQFNAIPA